MSGVPRVFLALALVALGALGALALGCRAGGPDEGAERAGDPVAAGDDGAESGATPVEVAAVELATLSAEVSASGRTVALVEQQVRAPFDGTLTALDAVEGEAVTRGRRLGEVVARDSEAALFGADEMVRRARTAGEQADAQRALELAERNRVAAPLVAAASGLVTARAAAAGDRVTAEQVLLTIADAGSVVFRADVPQGELGAVRLGRSATVEIAGEPKPLAARVAGFLAPEPKSDLTAPVRLDFAHPRTLPRAGLFGVAHVVVDTRRDVPVVPIAAVLRDDVAGTRRVGTVDAGGRLRWVEVETGLADATRVEIVAPPLAAGTRVVVSGQVGLADGTPLAIEP